MYDNMTVGQLIAALLDESRHDRPLIIEAIDRGWPRQGGGLYRAPGPDDEGKVLCGYHGWVAGPGCAACLVPTLTIPDDERTEQAIADAIQRWAGDDEVPVVYHVMSALRALSASVRR
jgi:hypothetical protein